MKDVIKQGWTSQLVIRQSFNIFVVGDAQKSLDNDSMTVVEDGGDRVPSGTDGEVDLWDQRTDNMQGGIFPPKMNFLLDVIPGLTLETLFERTIFSFLILPKLLLLCCQVFWMKARQGTCRSSRVRWQLFD